MLADAPVDGDDYEGRGLIAAYRCTGLLWGLADPDGAKRVLDEASSEATAETRSWIDALYVMYWVSMAKPDVARSFAAGMRLDALPDLMGAATSWALGSRTATAVTPRRRWRCSTRATTS